jgi:histone H2A
MPSKQDKAGLCFPVSRIQKALKNTSGMKRCGGTTGVYLGAVLEYITAEVMELSGNACKDAKRKRVSPEDMFTAIRDDKELSLLYAGSAILSGDKIEVDISLLKSSTKSSEKSKGETKGETKGAPKKAPKESSKKSKK